MLVAAAMRISAEVGAEEFRLADQTIGFVRPTARRVFGGSVWALLDLPAQNSCDLVFAQKPSRHISGIRAACRPRHMRTG
jgi:hypothetical protein